MKKICFVMLFMGSIITQAQTTSEAFEHMEQLTQPFVELKSGTWKYLKAVTRGKGARKVESTRQNLIKELYKARGVAMRTKPLKDDESLKQAVVNYLDLNYIVFREDFGRILDMEEIAEQSYDAMEAYLLAKERANEKLDSASEKMQQAQKDFAAKYNITLLEAENDKTSEKIKLASNAIGYYNDVYLIFFKVYKQEAYVMDALQRNDILALEQNTAALESIAEEGMEKLNALDNYNGDAQLKIGAKQMLSFYKAEAQKDLPAMMDFYIKKDNLEQVKKVVESKSQKNRTQQDVDQYNKAVEDFNASVPVYNKSLEASNEKRAKSLDDWNTKIESFFDKHTS